MPEPHHPGIKKNSEKELEEQAYRLRIFLEIVAEADMLLLKKLMKEWAEDQGEEKKT